MIPNNKNHEAILEFVYEMQKYSADFPRHLLLLISKFFKYDHLTFFPLYGNNSSYNLENLNVKYSTNFIALNLDRERLKLYAQYYYKTDIFQPSNLPKQLLKRSVLRISDIMSYNQYQSTEYYQFLNYNGYFYEMCIFLNIDNIHLGTIGVFRSKSDGDFTENDYLNMQSICKYITQNYKNSVDLAKISFRNDVFKCCNERLPIGTLILDDQFYVLECNKAAQEFCEELFENKANDTYTCYSDKIVYLNTNNKYIQKAINYLKNNYLNNPNNPNFNVYENNHVYSFNITSFFITCPFGNIKTIYSVCITKQENCFNKIIDQTARKYELTNRELEIVSLIKSGCSNKEIAEKMFISTHTVKAHITKLFNKTGVTNRTALINKLTNESQ
jgi:DNA-binding CsgD family transcriptional regulator